jgi:biotin operon repressor
MGKRKPTREARHVRIYVSMIATPAWRDLNCYGRAAYIEISSRYGGPKSNNGRIPYSGRELAENLRISKPTAQRAFNDLQDHGFIVLTKRGRYGRKRRLASEWRLTEFPCDVTEGPPTHAYRHWQGASRPAGVADFVNRAHAQNGRHKTGPEV